jgi:hypothetical protein
MVDGAIFKSADHIYSAYLTIMPGLMRVDAIVMRDDTVETVVARKS